MNSKTTLSWKKLSHGLMAISCAAILLPGQGLLLAQSPTATPATPAAPTPASPAEPVEAKIPPEQLEALVAPIALYPDSLLAQTLVASTYPLEVIQLQQWLAKHPELKDKALTDEVAKQPWDPAIQAMATIPELLKRLADDIQWATELGNAFLAQQSDVMDAVQRMRQKAKGNGALESNEQQKVETKVIEEKTVIVVESANPEIIYVPSYSPTVVYGPAPYYPYPPIYYPYYPPGAAFVSFSVGVAVGAAFWGGGCGWGHNDININRNTNINVGNGNRGNGNGNWSHDSSHRGAAPYSNKATADKFSGSSRGSSSAGNRASASTQSAGSNRGASASASNRSAGGSSRASSAGASSMDRSSGSRSPSASSSNVGSRDFSSGSSSRSSGFSGGSSGFSGSSARASSSRGASSMGGRGGGGGRRR
jgi:Protein of unknown function (DUF3300)